MTFDIKEIRSWAERGESISPRVVLELVHAHAVMHEALLSLNTNVSKQALKQVADIGHNTELTKCRK